MSVYQRRRRRTTTTSLDTEARSVTTYLVALLVAAELVRLAKAVETCSTEFWALRCVNGHTAQPLPIEVCGYRLCVFCARRRQQRAKKRVWPALLELQRRYVRDRWVFITLTVRSRQDPLQTIVTDFKRWFARLRRTAAWKDCIRGAVGSFEVTYHPDTGWHFHLHLLALRAAWWAQADLAQAWQRATRGAGVVVDIRAVQPVRRLERGLAETLKYAFKPANLAAWGPDQVAQFTALGRTKLSECYGELRGLVGELDDGEDRIGREPEELPLQAGDPCPACGEPLARVRIAREELRAVQAVWGWWDSG